jgi:hypothetical protein
VVSIAVVRVWIRCDECGCTWRDKPASYVLRRLFGRSFRWFTRQPRSAPVTAPELTVAADAPVAAEPRVVSAFRRKSDLEQWFDRCDPNLEAHTPLSVSVNEWLDNDPFAPPAEQPAPRDPRWVPPPRPTMQGTFVERLDALHSGLIKLERFVHKCTREEEATAKRLELPRAAAGGGR